MKLSEFLKSDEASATELLASSDYRSFLKIFFRLKKQLKPSYSYAVFARQADVAKSLPRDITEGLKRITDKNLPSFLKALELDGLMEEFFIQLVALDSDPKKANLVKRLAELYLETHFTKTYTDSNFQNHRFPFVYAASGEVGAGVSLEVLSKRTGLSIEEIKETLPHLENLKLGQFQADRERFVPATSQIHVIPDKEKNHFIDFYLYCLSLQQKQVSTKFNAEDSLFYNEVFSINEKDLPALKLELRKVLKSHVLKAENPNGDSVAVLNLGLFKQFFDPNFHP